MREWDRLIAEVKGESSDDSSARTSHKATNIQDQDSTSASGVIDMLPNRSGLQSEAPNSMSTVWDNICQKPAGSSTHTPFAAQLDALDVKLKVSIIKSQQSDTIAAASISPEVIQDWLSGDDADCMLLERDYQTPLHLGKGAETIARLVSRLLDQSNVRSRTTAEGEEASLEDPATLRRDEASIEIKTILDRLVKLNSGDQPLPFYIYPASQEVLEKQRRELHTAMATLFINAKTDRSPTKLVVTKLCHNLLITNTPANITTYNILLRGFSHLRLFDLGKEIVNSLFSHTKFSPNQATARLLLEYYTKIQNDARLRKFVDRLCGTQGDMHIRRRKISDLYRTDVQEWALRTKVVHRDGHLKQKFPRNSGVFNALIIGALQSKKTKWAVMLFRSAIREGQEIDSETFRRLSFRCTTYKEVMSGWSVLSTLLSQWKLNLMPVAISCSTVRTAIYQLLSLCGIKYLSYLQREGPLENVGGLDISTSQRAILESMLNYMRIEDLALDIERFSKLILKLQDVLGISQEQNGSSYIGNSKRLPTSSQRVRSALNILSDRSLIIETHARTLSTTRTTDQVIANQSQIALAVERSSRYIQDMQQQVISLYLETLPHHVRKSYITRIKCRKVAIKLRLLSRLHKGSVSGKPLLPHPPMLHRSEALPMTSGGIMRVRFRQQVGTQIPYLAANCT